MSFSWVSLFSHKPILLVLSTHLSINEIFALSCLNRFMYYKWSTNKDTINLTRLRQLILERFGWKYDKVNPFIMVRKNMFKAQEPLKKRRFRCTCGCNTYFSAESLVNRSLSMYTISVGCFIIKSSGKWFVEGSRDLYRMHLRIHNTQDRIENVLMSYVHCDRGINLYEMRIGKRVFSLRDIEEMEPERVESERKRIKWGPEDWVRH